MINEMVARLLFVLVLVSSDVFGQGWESRYFNKAGEKTDSASSYYFDIGQRFKHPTDSGSDTYVDTVWGFYTATKKFKSREIYNVLGMREGSFIYYHENGRVRSRGAHHGGQPLGYVISYYPHGSPQATVEYPAEKGSISPLSDLDFKIISYWDSVGTPLVTAGNGYCRCYLYSEDDQYVLEEGKVVDGLRDSVWTGMAGNTIAFQEEYARSEFKGGVRYINGTARQYSSHEVPPSFKGGLEALEKFLGKNLTYPLFARRRGIQGQVFGMFTIAEDGSLRDFWIRKGIEPHLNEETLRVMRLSPPWNPREQRGKPVRSLQFFPVRFKLPD